MGLFDRREESDRIERLLRQTSPMLIGMKRAEKTEVFLLPVPLAAAEKRLEAYVETDGALLEPAPLGLQTRFAALMGGTIACIGPSVLAIDLDEAGADTRCTVTAHARESVLGGKTAERAIAALRRGLLKEENN